MKEQADLSQGAASELKMMVMTRKNDDDDKEDDDYAIFQEQYKLSLKSGTRVAIMMKMIEMIMKIVMMLMMIIEMMMMMA